MSLFDKATFPECATLTVSKEEIYPVDVMTNGMNEYRTTPFDWEYYVWTIPSWNIVTETKDSIAKFLRQRRQGLRSFLYQDPNMPRLESNKIGHVAGNQWLLTIAYGHDDVGNHPVFHPGSDLVVHRNGFQVSNASFSIVDGRPIVSVPGSVASDVIRVTCDLYFAVRLNSSFGWTIQALNSNAQAAIVRHTDIVLKEVFEF